MRRYKLMIVGFGRLGRACAEAALDAHDVDLVGVVTRPTPAKLPAPFASVPVAGHPRDLSHPEAVLLCVPSEVATGVAGDLLQQRLPLVECAFLEGRELDAHYDAIGEAAKRHRVPVVVGAGWSPGMLPLLGRAFDILIPHGRTETRDRPGSSLHHAEAARLVSGVKDALATELRDAAGAMKRYLYVELERGASLDAVREAFARDPLFAGEQTEVFEVDSVASIDEASQGVVLERLGTARSGAHQNLLLEARFDAHTFAARTMLDAARRLERLQPGAHRYSLWP